MYDARPEPDFVLTVADCRQAGHCARGIREWFDRYGFEFRDVLRNGVSAQAVYDTNDGYGRGVVAHAQRRRDGIA